MDRLRNLFVLTLYAPDIRAIVHVRGIKCASAGFHTFFRSIQNRSYPTCDHSRFPFYDDPNIVNVVADFIRIR